MNDQFFSIVELAKAGVVINGVMIVLAASFICAFFMLWRVSRMLDVVTRLVTYVSVGLVTWAMFMSGWIQVLRPSFGAGGGNSRQDLLLQGLLWLVILVVWTVPLIFIGRKSEAYGPLDYMGRALAMGLGFVIPWLLGPLFTWSIVKNPRVLLPLPAMLILPSAVMGCGIAFARHRAGRVRQPFLYGLAVVLAGILGTVAVRIAVLADLEVPEDSYRYSKLLVLIGPLAALGLVLIFLGAWALERKIIAIELAEEIGFGVLPEWVREVIPTPRRRMKSDWWPRRDERREIVLLLGTLAVRKHRLRGLPPEQARIYGLEVGRLRQRARAILQPPVVSCAPPNEEIGIS